MTWQWQLGVTWQWQLNQIRIHKLNQDSSYENDHTFSDWIFAIDIEFFNKIFYCDLRVVNILGDFSNKYLRISIDYFQRIYVDGIPPASCYTCFRRSSLFVNNCNFTNIEIFNSLYFILLVVSMIIMQMFVNYFWLHKRNLPTGRFRRF